MAQPGWPGRHQQGDKPGLALGNAYRAVTRLTHFSGELEQITISYSFSFTELLAKKSHLGTGDTTLIVFIGQDFLHPELYLPCQTDLSQVQEEAGVLAGLGKVGEKDGDTDEQHCGVLTHLPQGLQGKG